MKQKRSLGEVIKNHKIVFIVILVLLVIGLLVGGYFIFAPKPESKPNEENQPTEQKAIGKVSSNYYYYNLTGKKAAKKEDQNIAVTAIMIENSPSSRPQSGLKNSGIVFEAIAEGGITRFLVLYQSEKPQIIGPVRSVRSYYVDWLTPFNASIAHVGGSYNALQTIRNGNYRDIDQFFYSQYYWRASDRYAPHNVYTKFENLDNLNKSKGYTTSNFTSFPRNDKERPALVTNATKINVNISSYLYNSEYKYDSTTNSYLRFQNGGAHTDREEGQIKPKVVIALMVNEQRVFEDGWREQIITTGSGECFVFQNGEVIKGTWKKSNQGAQIEFYNEKGDQIKLNRGQTWISAVPNGSGSVSWQ